ncbi:peptide deformylase [Parachitinimonas caeni]|uniref:Peptide deformylase n=1 Tax=Parachitinimonas caeni TaxID=3031301 RepID=A0ABT7DWA1_9NEIS|nr:peptide deformylase [Parachitinimonas caeni]MDK2124340.1 peptide deformylase [Parachitinimonas caeni]
MAIRDIVKMGDPLLLRVAEPVTDFGSPALTALVQDLLDTMQALNGAGIAAPQIGVSKQVTIFGGFKSPRYPDAEEIPFTILINPELTPIGDEMADDWEGCLSVPGMRGLVPRHTHLRYRGFGLDGQPIDRTVEGFHARVVQHECDHLFGVLYPMRIKDMRQFGFTDVLMPELAGMDD